MSRSILAFAFIPILALSACTKDEVVDDTTDTSDSQVELTWADMDDTQKAAYMASDVSPAMATLFQGYDSERFADFNCDTCHTDGSDKSMPSSDLYGFSPEEIPGPDAGEGAAFMHNEVVPKMRELLDDESFGCLGCHPSN